MKIVTLLNKANKGYPDGYLAEYYDAKTGEVCRDGRGVSVFNGGDTLAEFIVVELHEVVNPKTTSKSQIAAATHALQNAINDIQGVIDALNKA